MGKINRSLLKDMSTLFDKAIACMATLVFLHILAASRSGLMTQSKFCFYNAFYSFEVLFSGVLPYIEPDLSHNPEYVRKYVFFGEKSFFLRIKTQLL